MTPYQSPKKLPAHSQKMKEQKERDLDLDFDGDGLTEREERKYGLNPLSPDSDGDGLYDGQEVGRGSNPRSYSKVPPSVERGSEKEKLRDAYLHHVQTLLNAPVSYAVLYNQIAGDDWLGRSWDERVMAAELHSGNSLEEAKCLIAQSPYVQWQLSEGQWDKDSALGYVAELAAQFHLDRKSEEQLSE
ncbi:MAG: thrombospondin type 3 repeat-containing protein [Microcystaceae cyanobacterium]